MKLGKKILIFLNSIHFFLFCASAEKPSLIEIKPVKYVPRPLLIFLDDSEKDVNFVTGEFINALSSEYICPIIVSGHVLRNLFVGRTKLKGSKAELEREFKRIAALVNPTEGDVQKKDIFVNFLDFPEGWIIKQVFKEEHKFNHTLYLLIPRKFLNYFFPEIDEHFVRSIGEFNVEPTITNIELALGLKVNHMPTVTLDDVLAGRKSYQKSYFIEALGWFPEKRLWRDSLIFCTKSDYHVASFFTRPIWFIFMTGHGRFELSLAGISLVDFWLALDFFEHKITTHLLAYNSCYAAGTNQELLYRNDTTMQKKHIHSLL